jgi:hypothetical protein
VSSTPLLLVGEPGRQPAERGQHVVDVDGREVQQPERLVVLEIRDRRQEQRTVGLGVRLGEGVEVPAELDGVLGLEADRLPAERDRDLRELQARRAPHAGLVERDVAGCAQVRVALDAEVGFKAERPLDVAELDVDEAEPRGEVGLGEIDSGPQLQACLVRVELSGPAVRQADRHRPLEPDAEVHRGGELEPEGLDLRLVRGGAARPGPFGEGELEAVRGEPNVGEVVERSQRPEHVLLRGGHGEEVLERVVDGIGHQVTHVPRRERLRGGVEVREPRPGVGDLPERGEVDVDPGQTGEQPQDVGGRERHGGLQLADRRAIGRVQGAVVRRDRREVRHHRRGGPGLVPGVRVVVGVGEREPHDPVLFADERDRVELHVGGQVPDVESRPGPGRRRPARRRYRRRPRRR